MLRAWARALLEASIVRALDEILKPLSLRCCSRTNTAIFGQRVSADLLPYQGTIKTYNDICYSL